MALLAKCDSSALSGTFRFSWVAPYAFLCHRDFDSLLEMGGITRRSPAHAVARAQLRQFPPWDCGLSPAISSDMPSMSLSVTYAPTSVCCIDFYHCCFPQFDH